MIEWFKNAVEFYKTKNGKAAFFFGFYAIFFLCLFIYLGSFERSPVDNTDVEKNKSSDLYSFTVLETSDYKYDITIQKNYDISNITGDNNDLTSINDYEYQNLLQLTEIKRIIKNAKYLDQVLYSDDNYRLIYEIKTSTLLSLFESDITSTDEEINSLIVTTKDNQDVLSIEYDFSDYLHSLDEDVTIYKVLITYEY